MADDADGVPNAPIERIDWERLDSRRRLLTPRVVGFLAALAGLGALYWYDYQRNVDLFLDWSPSTLTWVFRFCLLVLLFLAGPQIIRSRDRLDRLWSRFAADRLTLAGVAVLAVFAVLGLVGPVLVGRPRVDLQVAYQPPAFFRVPYGRIAQHCVGRTVEGPVETQCVGTLAHPLGTARNGESMIALVLSGLHVSLQVAVIAVVLIVPIATAVGVTAGYYGGVVDEVLMRYVDVQGAVPAFVVYLILVFLFGPSLFLLIVVFGLLNWGNVARLVRSEVLQRREAAYVRAARAAGVGEATILRRHILPNVSSTVLVGATQQVPKLILIEAGLTFIDLGDIGRWYQSFGETIAVGFSFLDPLAAGVGSYGGSPLTIWWMWLLPAITLALLVASIGVVGDALRDALDPRGER